MSFGTDLNDGGSTHQVRPASPPTTPKARTEHSPTSDLAKEVLASSEPLIESTPPLETAAVLDVKAAIVLDPEASAVLVEAAKVSSIALAHFNEGGAHQGRAIGVTQTPPNFTLNLPPPPRRLRSSKPPLTPTTTAVPTTVLTPPAETEEAAPKRLDPQPRISRLIPPFELSGDISKAILEANTDLPGTREARFAKDQEAVFDGHDVTGALEASRDSEIETEPEETELRGVKIPEGLIEDLFLLEGDAKKKQMELQMELTRSVAERVFKSGTVIRDNQTLTIPGARHRFKALQTSAGVFLFSPTAGSLGNGKFKDVHYAVSTDSTPKEQAFAFSLDEKTELSTLSEKVGPRAAKERLNHTLAPMLLLKGLPNVAAPDHVISNPKHDHYGGLLFPFLNGGTYEANFAHLMTKGISEEPNKSNQIALKLMADAANGLAGIHASGLYHGDVKASNMVAQKTTDDTSVIITGYIIDLDGLTPLSHASERYRSEAYLSPQAHDSSLTGYDWSKDDVWSLGMNFCEMLTQKKITLPSQPRGFNTTFLLNELPAEQYIFQQEIQSFLKTHLPRELNHREEITHLICDMLIIDGTTRPLMAEVRDRLFRLMSPS